MAVMFDPNIPGGFPSGYGGASGVETGAGGGAGLGLTMAAAPVIASITGKDPTGFSQLMGALGFGKIKQSTTNRFKLISIANEVFDEFSFSLSTKDEKTRFASRWGNKLEHVPREQIVKLISEARNKAQEAVKKDAVEYKAGKPTTAEQDEIDRLKTLINRSTNPNNRDTYAQKQKLRHLEESITKRILQQKNLNLKGQHFFNKTVPNQKDPALLIPHFEGFLEQAIATFFDQTTTPEPTPVPDATFTGIDPRLTDEGQYTPPDPTVQDPEPTPEPGLITEPEPTPVETPTEPPTETPSDQGLFSDDAIAQFFSDEEQKAIVTNLEKAKAAQADADATPSDRNDAWGKVALGLATGAGLYGLLRLFQPRNGETTDGDINNLPRLNLNLPSSNRLGFNFSNTGGLTPVPPPALATLPTGVQSVRGIVPEFKYEDDYVGYPLL